MDQGIKVSEWVISAGCPDEYSAYICGIGDAGKWHIEYHIDLPIEGQTEEEGTATYNIEMDADIYGAGSFLDDYMTTRTLKEAVDFFYNITEEQITTLYRKHLSEYD